MSRVCALWDESGEISVVINISSSIRISFNRAGSEYICRTVQKNVGVALISTPIASPSSNREMSSIVAPYFFPTSRLTLRTPNASLSSPRAK